MELKGRLWFGILMRDYEYIFVMGFEKWVTFGVYYYYYLLAETRFFLIF
jgi:hypothetical protein